MHKGLLAYQPAEFEQRSLLTSLGTVAYYTCVRPTISTWTDNTPQEKPTVVFFHNFGGGASAYEWSKVYGALTHRYRVIAPDLVGWGESEHPQRQYKSEDYVQNIQEIIQQVGVKPSRVQRGDVQQKGVQPTETTPVIAVASSFTAGLVTRLAAQKPDLFSQLFLVCPAGFNDFGKGAGRRIPAPIINTPFLDKVIYALGATNELAVRNFLESFLFARPSRLSAETVSAYLTCAQKPNADYAALSFLRGDLYFDVAPYVCELQVPTAIVWGEKAQFTPVSTGQKLAALNPQAVRQFQVVSETGVLPHLEQPGVVTNLLLAWLCQQP
ncbi:MAG: alpha/beta hydrolase [Cyanobacteria bacterium J06634_5]